MNPGDSSERSSEKGATLVEFVFTAGIFFLLVMMVIDCTILGFRTVSLQYIASRTSREGLTPNTYATDNQETAAIRQKAINIAGAITIALKESEIQVCHDNQVDPLSGTCNCTYTPSGSPAADECTSGGEEDFVVVRIQQNIPMFFQFIRVPVVAVAAGMKEDA